MTSSALYDIMCAVSSLRSAVEKEHGIWDPTEREYGMRNDNSVSTRIWGILNDAVCDILVLMDEVTIAEHHEPVKLDVDLHTKYNGCDEPTA